MCFCGLFLTSSHPLKIQLGNRVAFGITKSQPLLQPPRMLSLHPGSWALRGCLLESWVFLLGALERDCPMQRVAAIPTVPSVAPGYGAGAAPPHRLCVIPAAAWLGGFPRWQPSPSPPDLLAAAVGLAVNRRSPSGNHRTATRALGFLWSLRKEFLSVWDGCSGSRRVASQGHSQSPQI